MKVLVCMDSFKGSLTSKEAGNAVKEGILKENKNSDVKVLVTADGGEGTTDAIINNLNEFKKIPVTALNPAFKSIDTYYYIINNDTALIESANIIGLTLIEEEKREPHAFTTYGLGTIIIDAINRGIKKFIITLGGSATNDGGIGMLTALGFSFLNYDKMPIDPIPTGLKDLQFIDDKYANKFLKDCEFEVACDVTNPLLYKDGCTNTFARQKGALEKVIPYMEKWLNGYAYMSSQFLKNDYKNYPGAGAAGGLGFAFKSYLNADLKKGADIVLEYLDFKNIVKDYDIVISGEGKSDNQTLMGKGPLEILKIAKENNKKTLLISGSIDDTYDFDNKYIDASFSAVNMPSSVNSLMDKKTAYKNLSGITAEIFKLIKGV